MALRQTFLVLLGCSVGLTTDGQSVTTCPGACQCDADEMLVDCTGGGMPQAPLAEVPNRTQSLVLDGNRISDLADGGWSRLAPWLRRLSLVDNSLESFPDTVLSGLPRLKSLDLSGNLISHLPTVTPTSLRKLTLSRNGLAYIAADSFQGLLHLRQLYADRCSISSVQAGAFANLPSLEILSLEDNLLDADPVGWFVQTPLRELHLSRNAIPLTTAVTTWLNVNGTLALGHLALASNGIQHLPGDVFRDLGSLEVLDLRGNGLTSIGEGDFSGLGGLRELRLGDNELTAIHEDCLASTPGLLALSLDGNQLESLPPRVFATAANQNLSPAPRGLPDMSDVSWAPALVFVNLNNNHLREVPNIQALTSLQTLGLSYNQIRSVDRAAFRHNAELREVYMGHNGLVFLDQELLEGLPSLRTLTLGGNPWWCDCRLTWMQDLMWSEEQPPWAENLAQEITCTMPESLKDRPLEYVSLELLQEQCPDLPIGVVMIVLLPLWFSILGFLVARFWIRRYGNFRKFKQHIRKNVHYSKRMRRTRRVGVAGHGITILPPSTKFSTDHRSISFPLQRRGHMYVELDTSDCPPDVSSRETNAWSETVV